MPLHAALATYMLKKVRMEWCMYSTADVLKFILRTLGGRVPHKSLTYLTFLAQYDIREREVRKYLAGGQPLACAEFYLWDGIASEEVADASEEFASEMGEVYLELIYEGPTPPLPPPVERRLAHIAVEYGDWRPWQLRRHAYKLLDLAIPEKRGDYAGHFIDRYLQVEGFKLKTKELLTGIT
jgi:hypothetical protein